GVGDYRPVDVHILFSTPQQPTAVVALKRNISLAPDQLLEPNPTVTSLCRATKDNPRLEYFLDFLGLDPIYGLQPLSRADYHALYDARAGSFPDATLYARVTRTGDG